MYKFIFWDLDGTIADTREGVRNSLNHGLEPYGTELTVDVRKFIGPPLRVSIPEVLGYDMEKTEAVIARYREHYIPIGVYECSMFPGVREAMTRLREAGCIQVITSSKPTEQCRNVVKKFGIDDLLDEVVGATLDGRIDSKLDVLNEAFRIMKESHPDFTKENTILIGDTKYDAIGAAQADIKCIGVSYGFGTVEELMENGVVSVQDTLDEICDELLK